MSSFFITFAKSFAAAAKTSIMRTTNIFIKFHGSIYQISTDQGIDAVGYFLSRPDIPAFAVSAGHGQTSASQTSCVVQRETSMAQTQPEIFQIY